MWPAPFPLAPVPARMTKTPNMGPTPLPTKADLRARALARRDGLSPETRAQASKNMAGFVATLDLPEGATAFYWPIRSEADPRPAALALARPLCLPAVTESGLVFRRWAEGDTLASGPLGLSEPLADAPVLKPAILIVPLAAFDRRGHRIGYGKGFYDRTLAQLPRAITIGLAFATQEIDHVPDETHDHALDFVVTEREIIATRAT